MKKKWIISLICVVFFVILIGFAVRVLKEDDRPKVVVVLKESHSEYWRMFESGAKQAFDDFGVNGKVIAPDSTYPITKQLNILKDVLKENPDALIVSLINPPVTIPILEEYKQKNISVLLSDTDLNWKGKTAYIGTGNYELGKKAGALLGSMLQPGEPVALIGGNVGESSLNDRIKGAKEALEEIGIEIATEQSGHNEQGQVKSITGTILQYYPDIKGIIAAHDLIALDALRVIEKKEAGIPVIGVDGLVEMVEYIEKGKLSTTLAQNPYDMAYVSVEQALKAIKGEPVEKRIDSGVDIITEDNAKDKLDFLRGIVHLK